MNLKTILKGISYEVVYGSDSVDIGKIEYDSRKIEKGDVFVCIEGFSTDGHNYIDSAVKSGAAVIICMRDIPKVDGCTVIKVEDTRKVLALISSNYYGNPASKLKIIGITGTNGKTTSTFIIKAILESAGYKVGVIGTIANYIGEEKFKTSRTTPESLELHGLFNQMVQKGVDYCVMEVSSHSLSLDRVYGIAFEEGIFTNLTQDHLDFHKTFENYYNAKLKLFKNSIRSVINMDDEYGRRVFNDIKTSKITYGIESQADISAQNIVMTSKGSEFNIVYKNEVVGVNINMPGKYNIMNALGCAAACINEGISLEAIKTGLHNMFGVPGRCELISKKYNLDYDIIIDYAHTPDGLENILNTAKEITKGKLISVFGCGGDRDKTKRPIMGDIGTRLSDVAIITSDNPRSEEPLQIINDILKGINLNNYFVIENRKEAIKKAIDIAAKDDVIVIAGKGHETYQILKDKTIHFDEREVIDEILMKNN